MQPHVGNFVHTGQCLARATALSEHLQMVKAMVEGRNAATGNNA